MQMRFSRLVYRALIIAGLLLTLWACSQTSSPAIPESSPLPSTTPPDPAEERPQPAHEESATTEQCEEPATEIELGIPFISEILGADQPPSERMYFCVRIPDGVSSITFELTGMASALNLFVGYPDLETVRHGGFSFWASQQEGAEDKIIIVEPVMTDYVKSGPYYIEVSAEDFRASSPFTLRVDVP